jgi:hypothetical protein
MTEEQAMTIIELLEQVFALGRVGVLALGYLVMASLFRLGRELMA